MKPVYEPEREGTKYLQGFSLTRMWTISPQSFSAPTYLHGDSSGGIKMARAAALRTAEGSNLILTTQSLAG
jgi:hypothetical protein